MCASIKQKNIGFRGGGGCDLDSKNGDRATINGKSNGEDGIREGDEKGERGGSWRWKRPSIDGDGTARLSQILGRGRRRRPRNGGEGPVIKGSNIDEVANDRADVIERRQSGVEERVARPEKAGRASEKVRSMERGSKRMAGVSMKPVRGSTPMTEIPATAVTAVRPPSGLQSAIMSAGLPDRHEGLPGGG